MTIASYMHQQHLDCDSLFVAMEELLQKTDWPRAEQALQVFIQETEAHFRREETILFPAFEEATGSNLGPTQMMRHEHGQMRGLFDELLAAAKQQDKQTFSGAFDTLLILMQQHNLKEENILYPMCDRVLPADQMQQAMEQAPGEPVPA